MSNRGIVSGFEVRTLMDATGRVIDCRSRPVTSEEMDAIFASATERGFDLRKASELASPEPVERERTPPPTKQVVSESKINKASTESRDTIERGFALGCDSRRVKELLVEFPERRVNRALDYLEQLISKGEEVRNPTGLVVSLIVRWTNASKDSRGS